MSRVTGMFSSLALEQIRMEAPRVKNERKPVLGLGLRGLGPECPRRWLSRGALSLSLSSALSLSGYGKGLSMGSPRRRLSRGDLSLSPPLSHTHTLGGYGKGRAPLDGGSACQERTVLVLACTVGGLGRRAYGAGCRTQGVGGAFWSTGESSALALERFRRGLVFKAHKLCVSLNSRLDSNKEKREERNSMLLSRRTCWNS